MLVDVCVCVCVFVRAFVRACASARESVTDRQRGGLLTIATWWVPLQIKYY
jgi:hypothetical protein